MRKSYLSRSSGRSRYGIEQLVSLEVCSQGNVVTLIDAWPKEAYAVYCPAQSPKALSCSWGSCEWGDQQLPISVFLSGESVKQ